MANRLGSNVLSQQLECLDNSGSIFRVKSDKRVKICFRRGVVLSVEVRAVVKAVASDPFGLVFRHLCAVGPLSSTES